MNTPGLDRHWTLVPDVGGGWTLETDDPLTMISVRRDTDAVGWRATGPAERSTRIVAATPTGFEERSASGEELARSSAPLGLTGDTRLRHLLLADGRLFRVVRRPEAVDGFDLLGWETPGSYLEARRSDRGWDVVPTPAGRAVDGLSAAALLFCMEIVDARSAATTDDT